MSKKRQAGEDVAPLPTQQLSASQITALYRSAIRELDEISEAQAAGDDQLEACLFSLLIVKKLIQADPSGGRATRSLDVLAMALEDIRKGAKPDLIFNREGLVGRPSGLSAEVIKGVSAACYKLLAEAEVADAFKTIEKELGRRGIKMPHTAKGPQLIVASQIERWHYEIDGYPNPKAKLVRDHILKGLAACPDGREPSPALDVSRILDSLKNKGF